MSLCVINHTSKKKILNINLLYGLSGTNHICKDTIPLRPINVVGLAHERSLTM